MKKCPSSRWCRDSNSRPLEHESPPITTRPGLPPTYLLYLGVLNFTTDELSSGEGSFKAQSIPLSLSRWIEQLLTEFKIWKNVKNFLGAFGLYFVAVLFYDQFWWDLFHLNSSAQTWQKFCYFKWKCFNGIRFVLILERRSFDSKVIY